MKHDWRVASRGHRRTIYECNNCRTRTHLKTKKNKRCSANSNHAWKKLTPNYKEMKPRWKCVKCNTTISLWEQPPNKYPIRPCRAWRDIPKCTHSYKYYKRSYKQWFCVHCKQPTKGAISLAI